MKKADNKKKRLYDLLLIGGVLILAAVLLLVFVLNRRGNSDTADGPCAVVLINGEEAGRYPLSQNGSFPLNGGTNTLVVEDGYACITVVREGAIKSAVGIGALLAEGIGDTIRVSLTGDPVDEVITAKMILKALDLRDGGITFISCPTCGRTQVPLIELAGQIEQKVANLPYNLKVAVMGCVVNGPGEARECDIGIAGGKDEFVLFEKGVPVRKIPASDAVDEFVREVKRLGEEKSKAT